MIKYFFGYALLILTATTVLADNGMCFDCHDDDEFETERNGMTVSLHVEPDAFANSVHGDLDCTDCHGDANDDHEEILAPVHCADCHEDEQIEFDISAHGRALARQAPFAPNCSDCHGSHDILPPNNPKSKTFKINIPRTCGRCHREGAPVAESYDLAEHNILENYSQSIHGEGLFKKGLTVTATCSDCHGSHSILELTDVRSTISPHNIANTCMQCHAQIEQVHDQVIRGELWEKELGAIPACTDCHRPHKARRELVAMTISDRDCQKCHENEDVFKVAEGDSLSMHVDMSLLRHSAHETIPCVKCHSDIDPRLDRPCTHAGTVDCSDCHAAVSDEYDFSGHGVAHAEGVEDAPSCTTCHGGHEILSKDEDESPIFRSNIPTLCAECHRDDGVAGEHEKVENPEAGSQYATSVHGRALTEMGLLPSAICTDCHSSHMILDHHDERSTVNHRNLATTCATCHRGIYKDFIQSIHYSNDPRDEKNLPSCANCHSSHEISETDQDAFVLEVTHQCGTCHEDLAATYFETMHGKAYTLGYSDAAKCSDCHGTHRILGHDDIGSMTNQVNMVETCKQCHDDANERFTGYLTHATHHDPERYPYLYYTYWGMTGLLLSVFTIFGLHTLLWMPRSFRAMWRRRRETRQHAPTKFIRRFTREQRIMHFFVIISFLSLALTGMMLKFASMTWASYLADLLGGAHNAGLIHRLAAIITFGYFAWHLRILVRYKRSEDISWIQLAFGPNSLMFNKNDAKDFVGTIKWFLGRGPRPQYGRWTYWEKFDYLAVFWGVAVIGISGLMLWFPEYFTLLLPGWVINIATIIHSDEALLAVGFIFTVHFFNTHLRPEAFPMDTVIFTGVVPLEHYREERGREVEELEASGEIDEVTVDTVHISRRRMWAIRIFGFSALFTGMILVGLIIYSMLVGYK